MKSNKGIKTKEYGKVYETNDYSKFNLISGNRSVDRFKVGRLVDSMKEKQLVVPIIVNEFYQIIDGQHRFSACKELNLPVYYIVIKGYGIEEVKRANLISSTWDLNAFLNLYCSKDNSDYITLKDFVDSYNVPIATILNFKASLTDTSFKREQELFKTGEFSFDGSEDILYEFLESLSMFDKCKYKRNTNLLKAYFSLFNRDEFDLSIMKAQLDKLVYKLNEQYDRTKDGFLDVLVNKVYSYRPGNKNKLTYDRGTQEFYVRKK